MSYFEYLKNLSHVRFGRLTRRWEEESREAMLDCGDYLSDHPVSLENRNLIIHSPSEKDIVVSGLEDIMVDACQATIRTAAKYKCSMRMAAYINAMQTIQKREKFD